MKVEFTLTKTNTIDWSKSQLLIKKESNTIVLSQKIGQTDDTFLGCVLNAENNNDIGRYPKLIKKDYELFNGEITLTN